MARGPGLVTLTTPRPPSERARDGFQGIGRMLRRDGAYFWPAGSALGLAAGATAGQGRRLRSRRVNSQAASTTNTSHGAMTTRP